MGFLNYYIRYIENFSSIAKSIYDLLKSYGDINDNKVKAKGKRGAQPPPNQSITWTTADQSALEKLIECLIDLPLMAYPEPNSPYVLHTDASKSGLGAVLYQEQNRKLRVIAYGSRTLTAAENNYNNNNS
jgi:hypothetical protein